MAEINDEADKRLSSRVTEIIEDIGSIVDTTKDHIIDHNNPHKVTKDQIGLGNVDNTADIDKPLPKSMLDALNKVEDELKNKANIKHNHDGVYQPIGDYVTGNVLNADLKTKSDINHNHDDKYQTKGNYAFDKDLKEGLASKSDINHNHDDKYQTKGDYPSLDTFTKAVEALTTELEGKAPIHTVDPTKIGAMFFGVSSHSDVADAVILPGGGTWEVQYFGFMVAVQGAYTYPGFENTGGNRYPGGTILAQKKSSPNPYSSFYIAWRIS